MGTRTKSTDPERVPETTRETLSRVNSRTTPTEPDDAPNVPPSSSTLCTETRVATNAAVPLSPESFAELM